MLGEAKNLVKKLRLINEQASRKWIKLIILKIIIC